MTYNLTSYILELRSNSTNRDWEISNKTMCLTLTVHVFGYELLFETETIDYLILPRVYTFLALKPD